MINKHEDIKNKNRDKILKLKLLKINFNCQNDENNRSCVQGCLLSPGIQIYFSIFSAKF